MRATTLGEPPEHQANPPVKTRCGPDGVLLFERETGLHVLLTGLAPTRSSWSPAPMHVSIALTNACDLACNFCYAPKVSATLDAVRLREWLRELDDGGCLGVGFGGGEPTLYRRLVELCTFAAGHTSLAVGLTTHGHYLTEQLIRELTGRVHFVRVSVDGVGVTYEHLRGRPFGAIVAALNRLAGRIPFGINCVVNDTTVRELDHLAQLGEQTGATELTFLPQAPTGAVNGCRDEVLAYLGAWIRSYTGPLRLSCSGSAEGVVDACRALPGERDLRSFAHIDARGVLKRTSYDSTGVVIGVGGVLEALAALESRGIT